MPAVGIVVIIDLIAIALIIAIHKYLTFYYGDSVIQFDWFLIFSCAAAICAFVDATVWGGSIDYIGVFDWFTCDLKDIYITISIIILAMGLLYKRGTINKATEKERGLIAWIKRGFPKLPS